MTYGLSILDELVYGSLSPFYAIGNNRQKHLEFLNQHFSSTDQITIGQFKKEKSRFIFQNKLVFSCIHPDAKKFISDQLHLFQELDLQNIDPDILNTMNIDPQLITRSVHQKQLKKWSIGFLQPIRWEILSDADLKYYYYCGLLLLEKDKLIINIKNQVHLINSKEEIEQYIHKHQQSLISLSVKLLNQSNFEKKYSRCKIRESYSDIDILSLIFHYLEKILRFIESKYPNYIDKNITIPYRSKLIEEHELEHKSALVKSTILDADLNSEIKTIILDPLFRLNQFHIRDRISYQELIYSNTYITEFYNNFKQNPAITESRIIQIMFHVNYNSMSFLAYLQKMIMTSLSDLGEKNLQLDYLYKVLKETNQKNLCSHLAFNPAELSLKVLLSAWIEEEIQYINKLKINQIAEDNLFSYVKNEKNKILSQLTVSELAFLFRLFHDSETFPHENQSEIIQFIAEGFYTKKAENISLASIRTKYYSPEEATITSLKLKFNNIISIIDRY